MRPAPTLILALLLALLPSAARAGERLLVPELPGWTVVNNSVGPVAEVTELVPGTETADNWSRRLSVQAFRVSPMSAMDFLDGLVARTTEVCDGIDIGPVAPAPLPGIEGGRRTIACGSYRGDGRGSFTLFYALRGRDALYVLARAWRGDPFQPGRLPISASELADWNATFDGVRLCDTDDPARPCPSQ